MRLAVTGRHGQVARALTEAGPLLGVEVVPIGRPELDLAKPETVRPALAEAEPHIVTNAAAYTAVDQAEQEPNQARGERQPQSGGHTDSINGVPDAGSSAKKFATRLQKGGTSSWRPAATLARFAENLPRPFEQRCLTAIVDVPL